MSKVKKIIISILIILIIVLGGLYYIGKESNKAYDKAVSYLNNKEYDKTIAALDLVLDDNKDDKKALNLKSSVQHYLDAKNELDKDNFEKAKENINLINEYGDYKSFNEDINNLKLKINDFEKENKKINEELQKINKDIKDNNLDVAKKEIVELQKEKLNKNQSKEVNDLDKVINTKKEKEIQKEKEEKLKKEKAKNNSDNFIENFKNSNKDLTQEEATKLLKLKVGDGGKVAFSYVGSTGVQASIVYEYLQNYTTSHTHGPHVFVNASTGEIIDQDNEILSPVIRPLE